MNRATAACAVILMAMSAAALAQTSPSAPGDLSADPIPVDRAPASAVPMIARPETPRVQQEIAESLRKAGFRDVRIVPRAFIIQATSQTGDPLTMFLSPDSHKVFIAQDANGQDTMTATAAQTGDAPVK
jgi:hypothetical protein